MNDSDTQAAEQEPKRLKLMGTRRASRGYLLRDFLNRGNIPFDWIELTSDAEARELAGVESLSDPRLPVCIFNDGERLECPEIRQISEKLGWFKTPSRSEYDLAIFGGGPAGLSAAVYGASEGLRTVLIERFMVGGQAGSTSKIENYLGFPAGITGAELAERAREQACKFGAEILLLRTGVRAEFPPGRGVGYLEDGSKIVAHASICSTGIAYRRLNLPNEERFSGAGVFYGAGVSEAALCKGDHVFIVGGGNSAGQAAMHFARYAAKVTMVIRGKGLSETVSQYLVDRILSSPAIDVLTFTEVTALDGRDTLESITLTSKLTGEERKEVTDAVFLCLGGSPHTQWAEDLGILRDPAGYLVTGPDLKAFGLSNENWPLDREPYYLETSMPGLFAAGDVRHGSVKRCAAAVGEGAMAVTLAHRYLSNH